MSLVRVKWIEDDEHGNKKWRKGIAIGYVWDPTYQSPLGGVIAVIRSNNKLITKPLDQIGVEDWA